MTRVVYRIWRIGRLAALALAMMALAPDARAQHGGMGGFHGGAPGGFHGGYGGGYHDGDHHHGGSPVFRFGFGFGGWPFWPFWGGYPAYYPPAYPTYPYYYAPPAPYAAPMPYPAPAAVAHTSFAVYFTTNSDQLNAAAHATVAQAAAAAAHGNEPLAVTGYADATGSAAHNLDLSRRRAEYVGAALVAAGVPQQQIALGWHGESAGSEGDPARDRRVVITIGGEPQNVPPPNAVPYPPPAPLPPLPAM